MADDAPLTAAELQQYLAKATPGTQDYVTAKQMLDSMSTAAPAARPVPASPPPGPDYPSDVKPWAPPDINYSAPQAEVRTALNAYPEGSADRTGGWDKWADIQEQQRATESGVPGGVGDLMRLMVQGTPFGKWPSRANAAISSVLPESVGGMPYEEKLALENARDRGNLARHPIGAPVANLAGGAATAAATGLRGFGAPALAGNVAIDTASSASRAASEAPNLTDTGDVGGRVLRDTAITAPISLGVNALARSLSKYSSVIPAVAQAAERLGIQLPFFAQAESRLAQGEGRRYVQHHLDTGVNRSWDQGQQGTVDVAGDIASRNAGSPDVGTAPYQAGTAVNPALQGAIDAGQAEKGRLSEEIARSIPGGPNQRFDFPNMRDTTQRMVDERAGAGIVNPRAGLGDQLSFSGREPPRQGPWGTAGGSTWEEGATQATELGQRIGLPASLPRDVSDTRLQTIYGALRNDQRGIVQQSGGDVAGFDANVAQQRLISDGQRAIADAMQDRPEAVVNLVHGATTTRGAGTDINALTTIIGSLPPQDRQILAGGVLGKIVNDANGSPQRIATTLESMPDATRNLLFQPGTRIAGEVDDLLTVTRQLGDVNALQDVGSAATRGPAMAAGKGLLGPAGIATGGLGYILGAPKEAAIAMGVGSGAAGAYNQIAKPLLMQHGLPPALVEAVNAAMRSGAQQAPSIYDNATGGP